MQYQAGIQLNFDDEYEYLLSVLGKLTPAVANLIHPHVVKKKPKEQRLRLPSEDELLAMIQKLRDLGVEPSPNQSKKFQEFTVHDFQRQASRITRSYQRARKQALGKEAKVSKLLSVEPDKGRVSWMVPPTDSSRPAQGVDLKTNVAKTVPFYVAMMEFEDLAEWVADHPSFPEFKEIVRTLDVKLSCDCMSFTWQGMRWQLSQLDSAIYPISVPDPVWKQRHKGDHALCKHLLGIINNWSAWERAIYRQMQP